MYVEIVLDTSVSKDSLELVVALLSYLKLQLRIIYKDSGSTTTGVIDATVYGDKSFTS